ncbi:hypothetical protein [Halorubrum sp. Eb13]|uniref:DUF7527 domain-containing protein n=1 Tax=Halorubrum sp. Eb13 TaxID=1383843 RepID=UPI000B99C52F|nr:hypothetical protein [Halorubrum sp. Eb13]OYR39464.1 hypothetical protein DJ75_16490 [Halorubrum sp. Eb13]
MDAQRRSEITEWDSRGFSGGFAELGRLVDRGFSGAVTDGTAWLFVFEGRVVGAVDGDLADFSEASGTLYEAPEPVLPVLFAMQERGGEPRAQYYTNDTPLSEADQKLSRGGFTGYVELSENVLSGDYYVTYTAGESMTAAYVGNSRRLETGEKAFSLADDEVGIYTVYEVDLSVREIPSDGDAGAAESGAASTAEPSLDGSAAADPEPSAAGRDGDSDRDDVTAADEPGDAAADDADGSPARHGVAGSERADESRESPAGRDETEAGGDDGPSPVRVGGSDGRDTDGRDTDGRDTDGRDTDGRDTDGERREANGERSADAERGANEARSADDAALDAGAGADEPASDAEAAATSDARDDGEPSDAAAVSADSDRPEGEPHPSDDVFSEEEEWREQKSIPALDPSESSDPPTGRDGNGGGSASGSRRSRGSNGAARRNDPEPGGQSAGDDSPDPRSTAEADSNRSAVSQRSRGADGSTGDGRGQDRLRQLKSALEESERKRESLAAELDETVADRDDVEAERDELAAEVDRLESELSTLREERDRLREELAAARDRLPEGDRSLSPAEARSGTNLFVRYDSKGGATLEDAHDGAVDRDALSENLRIEHHTSFETDGLTVDGRPYEEFLRDTIEYGFTRWLVEDLPFEVSGTGNQSVLRDLYDAIPEVDRAEIGGSVSIAIRENGEETREQRAFDLVLRDRMGNPLFVADLNDSRDPTAEGTLESLVGNGRDIAESNDSFAAAFAVTESFFEPGALETASDAVGGGLFSRSKRASFVKLSRKQGYHLCLVEARDGGFHMTVPDL